VGGLPDAGDEEENENIEEIGMESYYYVNIFETKGLEYLLLMAFLVLLVLLFRYFKTPGSEEPE
jgi:hypothetical protein